MILRKKQIPLVISLLLMLASYGVHAQQTFEYRNPENSMKRAAELFDKKLYTAAQEAFASVIAQTDGVSDASRTDAAFYYALCAARLNQRASEFQLQKFIQANPVSVHKVDAKFELALLYFRQKKYKQVVKSFEDLDAFYLSEAQKDEMYYKQGYSYFSINEDDKAAASFFHLIDKVSPYSVGACYYYAHLSYQKKSYETALQNFIKIKDTPEYSSSVPYYISQIYYIQEKFDLLITYATPLLDQANPVHSLEISRMIGEAYFRQMKYAEAIPFLQTYLDNSNKVTREEYYQLGFANYKTGRYAAAIPLMDKTVTLDDAMTQNAYYLLADCFLRAGKKQNARNAFRLSSQMVYDQEIQENALFSFAKLSYELSIQSDAVDAFQKYKKLFPQSNRIDLVNQYLAGIFLTTRNYKDALAAMENIQKKSEQMKTAYQRTAYFRGLEFFSDVKYSEAIVLFEKAMIYPKDPLLSAQANYWEAESYYNMKNYAEAIKSYKDFLFSPQAINLSLFNTANYNTGYCYFKLEDYTNAAVAFRKYIKSNEGKGEQLDLAKNNDALLRLADCYFITHDYSQAAEYYDQGLAQKAMASDYALFQRGMIAGIQNKQREKIEFLQQLVDRYIKSPYFDDALYELAHSSFIIGDNDKALSLFQKVVTDYPKSSYVPKCLDGSGLIYFNNKQDMEAMTAYKQVVKDYPGTAEARTALQGIKNIYVSEGNAAEYLTYAATVPFADNTRSVQDSVTYEAAEVVYMKGDANASLKAMGDYLDTFSDGSFLLNATFYKAECQYRLKQTEWALKGYEVVIAAPRSTFTETSLLRAAALYFKVPDYAKALTSFIALQSSSELRSNIVEAEIGKMRCYYQLKDFENAFQSAEKVDTLEKVTPELHSESRLIVGKSALLKAEPDTALALKVLSEISKENSERGAEAKYLLAQIHYKQTQYAESQKSVFELVNQVPSYDDWIARGFILLADTYLAQNDIFQAKATLQSVITNYDGDDKIVVPMAVEKLNSILNHEKLIQEQEQKEKLVGTPDSVIVDPAPSHE